MVQSRTKSPSETLTKKSTQSQPHSSLEPTPIYLLPCRSTRVKKNFQKDYHDKDLPGKISTRRYISKSLRTVILSFLRAQEIKELRFRSMYDKNSSELRPTVDFVPIRSGGPSTPSLYMTNGSKSAIPRKPSIPTRYTSG